jgi:glycine C-acetyltransferase/8-amino-7-oxononanoate synthase
MSAEKQPPTFARAVTGDKTYHWPMIEAEPLEMAGDNEVRWRNRTLIHFSGCDYFRLARHSAVASMARSALEKTGLNVAASRLTTGNRKLYADLEKELAAFFDAETAVVLPNGYLAPMAVAQALAGKFSHVFVDELSHVALIDATRMLDCRVKVFPHRDVASLARNVAKLAAGSRPIILTDGMFSHDGSVAPLSEYLKILPPAGMILVDDAHGAGVLGARGRGTLEQTGVNRTRIIQCATLSKAFGVYGGVVLGTRALRAKIVTRSRLFAGSTPLPPPLAGAALAALQILKREPVRRERLFRNVSWLRNRLRESGWEIAETPGPIVRLPSMNSAAANELKKRLLAASIYPPFVKYGKASAAGFFRFVISSGHTELHLDKLARVLGAFNRHYSNDF